MAITNSASGVLLQLAEVLEKITDQQYNSPIELLSNTSIGAHVRHTLEFFLCLKEGADKNSINYDLRRRDPVLETDRVTAIRQARKLAAEVSRFKTKGPINLESVAGDESDVNHPMPSSLTRELWYTIEHAVHHLAIIKIGIKSMEPSFQFPEHFGVASSTVKYQLTKN